MLKIFFIEFQTYPTGKNKVLKLPEIEHTYKKNNLSQILNFRKEQEIGNLIKLINQSNAGLYQDFFPIIELKIPLNLQK